MALRHVGKLKSTDTRCIVVMMQLPNNPEMALIAETDSMPDLYHQQVMKLLESREGQASSDFYNILTGRRMTTEHGEKIMINALHDRNLMRSVSIDEILMVPMPGRAFSLRDVLQSMGRLNGLTPLSRQDDPNMSKFNPMQHNMTADAAENVSGKARGILVQADMLQSEANRLREQAYQINPGLRPRPRPVMGAMDPAILASVPEPVSIDIVAQPIEITTENSAKPRGRPRKA